MKRYLVFSGADYYPSGGWGDFQEAFDNLEQARSRAKALENLGTTWSEVIDTQTMSDVYNV